MLGRMGIIRGYVGHWGYFGKRGVLGGNRAWVVDGTKELVKGDYRGALEGSRGLTAQGSRGPGI